MKKIIAASLLLLAVTSGCSISNTPTDDTNTDNIGYREVETPDGRTIPCFVYAHGNKSGLSCDWSK